MRGIARALLGAATLATLAACSSMTPIGPAPNYAAVIAAPDRTEADRKNDDRREPVKLLAFTGVRSGMKVLDMAAGAGYSTEIMARGANPGTVYAQNPPGMPQKPIDALTERMKSPAMKHAVMIERSFESPAPADTHDLDLITFFFGYHDTTYLPVDRMKMDKAMFDALKPGGTVVIADYAASIADGTSVGKKYHRIGEEALKREMLAAGFKFVDEGMFLRNPKDTHDFVVFNPKIPIDIFVVKFQKP